MRPENNQSHVMENLVGHEKDSRFYSVCSRKLLKGLQQGSGMV